HRPRQTGKLATSQRLRKNCTGGRIRPPSECSETRFATHYRHCLHCETHYLTTRATAPLLANAARNGAPLICSLSGKVGEKWEPLICSLPAVCNKAQHTPKFRVYKG